MKIGIDIDDTLTLTYEKLIMTALNYDKNKVLGKGFKDSKAYKFVDKFYWSKDNVDDFFSTLNRKELYENLDVRDKAVAVVNRLYEEGNEIILISRRNNDLETFNVTRQWLFQKGFKYHQLFLGTCDKGNFCEDNKIDIFIDNEEANVRAVLDKNIKALLIATNENDNVMDLVRLQTWDEIYDYINEVKEWDE